MIDFGFETTDTTEFDEVENGVYEVYVSACHRKIAKTGTHYISLTLKVRDDVEQEYQNCVVFQNVFAKKGGDIFTRASLEGLVLAFKPQQLVFKTLDDLVEALRGCVATIKTEIKSHQYNGKNYRSAEVVGLKTTNLGAYTPAETVEDDIELDFDFSRLGV